MPAGDTRRHFLEMSAAAGAALRVGDAAQAGGPGGPVRVVGWDEQQSAQKEAYDDFLGNWIARTSNPGRASP